MFYLKNGPIDFRQILSVIEMSKKVDQHFGCSQELLPYQNLFMDSIKTEFKALMEKSEPEGDQEYFPVDEKTYANVNKNMEIILQL